MGTNIWALNKDDSIKHLLLLLAQTFGQDAFTLIPASEDEKAVRLIKTGDHDLSVYIYTYGQIEEHYGVHLEYPDIQETSLSSTLDIYDNVSYETLCGLVESHLNCRIICTSA